MSLRLKLVLALTLLAMSATVVIGVVSYRATGRQLISTVDQSLENAAQRIASRPGSVIPAVDTNGDGDGPIFDRPRSFEQVLVQALDRNGSVVASPRSGILPVEPIDIRVATSSNPRAEAWHTVAIDGDEYRMLTVKFGSGAVQLARSLEESREALGRILRSTLIASVIVALASWLLGLWIARQVTRRLERLTAVAGEVASTGRLDVDVPTDGNDETGTLGRALSGMLAALQTSKQEQHQLVQDAGHELRTPLTSLRTNISVMRRRFDDLPAESREQLLADLDSETRELTDLVNELVELATDRRDDEPVQQVRLADVVERAAARARRRFDRDVQVRADDTMVEGRPNRLERAVQNLVDNACKFADDGAVEVTIIRGTVTVRDHGPGVAAADLPHLFDRFYRSVEMRSKPGSGLGLSIVKSIVESHGGEVFARNASGGGAEIGFTLPMS